MKTDVSFRTRVNRVKRLFPNYFYHSDGYYNFAHEIRESQKHTFYHLLKDTFRDYVHTGEVNLRIAEAEKERLNEQRERAMNNPIVSATPDGLAEVLRTIDKQITQCNEAISFLNVLAL